MIDATQLRKGVAFEHDGQLVKVLDYEHRKQGRGKATIRVKVRNMRTGSRTEITFSSNERVSDVRLEKLPYEYLYEDGTFLVFMNTETYAQVNVPINILDEDVLLLTDNLTIELLFYGTEVLDYKFPQSVEMDVVEAENAIAGDTATGATKECILTTGLKVRTPLFIKEGDRLKIDTSNHNYITRV